jgi:hypothetical protein
MGWDTQISVLVESVVNEEVVIAREIYETDARSYGPSFATYREAEDNTKVLFYTYNRRKYLRWSDLAGQTTCLVKDRIKW